MYQALYRKYRPQTFDDVVGQQSVTQTLKNQVVNQRLSHAYLFTGTRGTGKTSCAKILAKAVNCEQPQNGNPCNCCPACRSIDSGACMDVLEIDAASNNGVDSVRALRDDAIYTPAEVSRRVYIIDEVHMLSISAFNALLKIIEEPPEHLLFILATTELHKVPATILSRCQRFAFRRLLPEDIAGRLSEIAAREQIPLEPQAASFLARLADGAMRDAISLLDQCASAAVGTVTTQTICQTIGLAESRKTAEMLRAIAARDAAAVLHIFHEEYAGGKDLTAMLDELCSVARDLLVLRAARGDGGSMISGICTQEELDELAACFTSAELLRMTEALRDAAAGFRDSANRRVDAELCLLRLCTPEAQLDAQSLSARISRLEDKLAGAVLAAPVQQQRAPAAQEPEQSRTPESPPWEEEPPQPAPPPVSAPPQPNRFWPELVKRVRASLKPPALGMFNTAENAPVRGVLDGATLRLEAADALTLAVINKPNVLQAVSEAAAAILGRSITACAVPRGSENTSGFERLLRVGAAHPDIVEIK